MSDQKPCADTVAQTTISLPTGAPTGSASRKRPGGEEETPELATDTAASETATPSNTPPSVNTVNSPAAVNIPVPGICASTFDAAAGAASSGSPGDGTEGGDVSCANEGNNDDGMDDEINEATAAQDTDRSGESKGEAVLPDLPPQEHLFRSSIDASEKLGCEISLPKPEESLYWQITAVEKGSQAERKGIREGHFIISIDGERLVNGNVPVVAFKRAMSTGKPFEIVTSDFPTKAAAREQHQESENAESGSLDENHNPTSRTTSTPIQEQSPDDTVREEPVSPAIRRAMTVQNSPTSKSPYHTFDRVSRSIVLGPAGTTLLEFGVLRYELRRLIKECTKRLCIFPQDDRPWLDYALNLVFSELCYNAPDRALGWNEPIDEHRLRGLGVRAELTGPQPWLATRAFIVRCIKEMLEAENDDWISSNSRKASLKKHHEPRIKQYLRAWNSDLSKPGHSQLLQAYTDHVWADFMKEHMPTNDNVGALYKLSERWIIQSACKFPGCNASSVPAPTSPDPAVFDRIRSIVDGKSCSCESNGVRMCKCNKLPYELYPFTKDRESVASTVLRRFQENRVTVRVSDITKETVRSILDDMEDENGFITKLNGLYTVTVAAASKLPSDPDDAENSASDSDDQKSQLDATMEDREISVHAAIENETQSPLVEVEAVLFSSDSDDSSITSVDNSPNFGSSDRDNDVAQQRQATMTSASASSLYSTTRDIGSRVYCMHTDDEYYWGMVIAKREGLVTVLFDDGIQHDIIDDDTCIITEKEYACLFSTPPLPPRKRSRREVSSIDLCGRGYCHAYTDREGTKRVIYGVVSRQLDSEAYNIEFGKDCLSSINETAMAVDPPRRIEPTQDIASDLAIAGCMAFDRIMKATNRIEKLSKKTPLRYLVVPEMRHEERVEYNGIQVPKLTIVLRAHQFVFNVKNSSIGNDASLGVFVKCTSLLENASAFCGDTQILGSVLKMGEILDVGVLNNSCFEHVNRCGPNDVATVHEELDPEGNKHYYFGVRYHGDYQSYKHDCSRLNLTTNEDEEVEILLANTTASCLSSA